MKSVFDSWEEERPEGGATLESQRSEWHGYSNLRRGQLQIPDGDDDGDGNIWSSAEDFKPGY